MWWQRRSVRRQCFEQGPVIREWLAGGQSLLASCCFSLCKIVHWFNQWLSDGPSEVETAHLKILATSSSSLLITTILVGRFGMPSVCDQRVVSMEAVISQTHQTPLTFSSLQLVLVLILNPCSVCSKLGYQFNVLAIFRNNPLLV